MKSLIEIIWKKKYKIIGNKSLPIPKYPQKKAFTQKCYYEQSLKAAIVNQEKYKKSTSFFQILDAKSNINTNFYHNMY